MVVEYECADGIALVHLNRPDRLNAVVPALTEDLLAAFARADSDGARTIVLAGRGRAFCAGYDLKEPMPDQSVSAARAQLEALQEITRWVRAFPGVVIAAVHGYALGAGCEFALTCDLVVADESARFGFPEVGVGLSVTGGISALLPRVVGLPRAKELLLFGERIDATRAAELGLINKVAPLGEHVAVARDLARRILAQPPLAVELAKRVLDDGAESTVAQAMATEVDHGLAVTLSGEQAPARQEFGRG